MEPRVVNLRDPGPLTCMYIGRSRARFHFGNPFGIKHRNGTTTRSAVVTLKILDTYDRDDSITAYDDWLDGTAHQEVDPERRLWILRNIPKLRGQDLGCTCAPKTCHGDVLLRRANA